jgi:hypothetical protein
LLIWSVGFAWESGKVSSSAGGCSSVEILVVILVNLWILALTVLGWILSLAWLLVRLLRRLLLRHVWALSWRGRKVVVIIVVNVVFVTPFLEKYENNSSSYNSEDDKTSDYTTYDTSDRSLLLCLLDETRRS